MVSTPMKLSLASRGISPRHSCNRAISEPQSGFRVTFAMALICLCVVTVFVPESPDHLASICEKHNSVVACQVW